MRIRIHGLAIVTGAAALVATLAGGQLIAQTSGSGGSGTPGTTNGTTNDGSGAIDQQTGSTPSAITTGNPIASPTEGGLGSPDSNANATATPIDQSGMPTQTAAPGESPFPAASSTEVPSASPSPTF